MQLPGKMTVVNEETLFPSNAAFSSLIPSSQALRIADESHCNKMGPK